MRLYHTGREIIKIPDITTGQEMEVRPRHLEGMKTLGKQIICAGGLLDEDGRMKGSALVMEFPDRAAVDEYLRNEPYVSEGVWEKIEVETMNVVLFRGDAPSLWSAAGYGEKKQ